MTLLYSFEQREASPLQTEARLNGVAWTGQAVSRAATRTALEREEEEEAEAELLASLILPRERCDFYDLVLGGGNDH